MSLAGVWACFMAIDMECDYFFWLLLAEWVRAGALLFLVSPLTQWTRSYRRCGLSTVSSTPVSPRTLLEEFPCLCALLALSAHGVWAIRSWPSYLAVIIVVSGCCLWRTIGLSGRCLGRNAWLDTGYMFCVSLERLYDEFHTFSMMRWTRILQCCLRSHAERRSVLSRCFSLWSFRASHTWKSVADSGCDGGIFAAFSQHFELIPWVSAQALAHGKICLSDLHRHGAFVAIHIPSRKHVSETTTTQAVFRKRFLC